MNNEQTKTPLGLSIALGKDIEGSDLYKFADHLNVRYNVKQASKDPNLSLMLLTSSGIEQFLSSGNREKVEDGAMERIIKDVQSYSPHTPEEKLKRQAVSSNDIMRISQALFASVSPVFQCSDAEVIRSQSVENDKCFVAQEQSKYLSKSVFEMAKSEYLKSSESDEGLSSLGIVLSSIASICAGSRAVGVSRDVLAIALINMLQEIVSEELAETNPINQVAKAFNK